MKGLLIVLYGPNNVGKSRQMALLEERLKQCHRLYKLVKYPIYELAPSGPTLEKIIKKRSESLPEEETQKLFAQNRRDFEPTLKSWLDQGLIVIAEDYKGTGLTWGVTRGLSLEKLEKMNEGLIEPDLAIVLDGPRRSEGLEEGHLYEDEQEWYEARRVYLQLADKYGWVKVDGDAPILTVAGRMWSVIHPVLAARG